MPWDETIFWGLAEAGHRVAAAGAILLMLHTGAFAQMSGNPLEGLNAPGKMDVYTHSKSRSGVSSNEAAKNCLGAAKSEPKSGNSVADTRCALVAYEVCMHKAIGTVSQSQDSAKQCGIIRGLAGPGACAKPCAEAAHLPVGGDGEVRTARGRYTGLTPFAVACYNDTLSKGGGVTGTYACVRQEALECLMNGSASAEVNAAIRQERRDSCVVFHRENPGAACAACAGAEPRVDYAPGRNDLDAKYCTVEMASAKLCNPNAGAVK